MGREASETVVLSFEVPRSDPRWVLDDDEERMPESPAHEAVIDLLKEVLRQWVRTRGASAQVGGNIALRWDSANPAVGVDPDVYLVEPAPPMDPGDKSLRTWLPGHAPPRVAVEVVSSATAREDYHDKPPKYAASKTRELWVFDPLLRGPRAERCRLQVWRRVSKNTFRRVYAGDGPARSEELGAWIVCTDQHRRLRLADDPAGCVLWPTAEEAERAAKESALAAADAERAAKESALAEVERLRAELVRLRG